MTSTPYCLSRRELLAAGAALFATPRALRGKPGSGQRPRIAAATTVFRENSHADVLIPKFVTSCDYPGAELKPEVDVVSLYIEQTPANDIGRAFAREHNIPVFPSIAGALCVGGGELAVDGVLLVAEHGDYPHNEKGQHLYPRRRFFEEAVAVIRPAVAAGRPAPAVFSDKHLSTSSWEDAKWMVDTAHELKVPFMAGSSLPVTWRRPPLELTVGVELEEALAVGYSDLNAYGFHALETLQCMVERRKGGETGVRSVQCVTGERVWKAAEPGPGGAPGRWNRALLQAALERAERQTPGRPEDNVKAPLAILIEYRDGLRASMHMMDGQAAAFLFATQRKGAAGPDASLFWLQEPKPFAHFARLAAAVQRMFLTRRPTYPVERTLLTSGILLAAHDSLHADGKRIETPEMAVRYRVS
jgi:hypothetical protein